MEYLLALILFILLVYASLDDLYSGEVDLLICGGLLLLLIAWSVIVYGFLPAAGALITVAAGAVTREVLARLKKTTGEALYGTPDLCLMVASCACGQYWWLAIIVAHLLLGLYGVVRLLWEVGCRKADIKQALSANIRAVPILSLGIGIVYVYSRLLQQ